MQAGVASGCALAMDSVGKRLHICKISVSGDFRGCEWISSNGGQGAGSITASVPVGCSGAAWALGMSDEAQQVSTETRLSSAFRQLMISNGREVDVIPNPGSAPDRAEYGEQFIPEW